MPTWGVPPKRVVVDYRTTRNGLYAARRVWDGELYDDDRLWVNGRHFATIPTSCDILEDGIVLIQVPWS